MEDANKSYVEYSFVFQQYIDLPAVETNIDGKKHRVHQIFGSFLLNGHASSIGYRVGRQITNNMSYYLPLSIQKDER
jgi:glutathionylspermidine synthase